VRRQPNEVEGPHAAGSINRPIEFFHHGSSLLIDFPGRASAGRGLWAFQVAQKEVLGLRPDSRNWMIQDDL